MTIPTATLSHSHRADGSATYSQGGYTVVAGVNGPVEVQRRDELPEEAAIEVNVRPAVGVGSPKERQLESIIHSTLRNVVLTRNHPRTLIQVTLQVVSTPEDESLLRSAHSLSILPSLLQASILALLSASIPLSATFNAASISLSPSGSLSLNPPPKALADASSVHVFAFSSHGDSLVSESSGSFSVSDWERAHDEARKACIRDPETEAETDGAMEVEGEEAQTNSQSFVEKVVAERVEKERYWKDST